MSDPTAIQSANPEGTANKISTYFQKDRIANMLTMADQFFKSGCFGGDVKNTHQALVKIQTGLEMGMAPMESMNSLYIVNGKVNIYGSAMTKKLRQAGWTISDEYDDDANPKLCKVTVSKGEESYSYESTLLELEKLNSQAAKKAPKDKLFWHGVGRIIRKYIPEVLDSGVIYLAEEAEFMDAAIDISAEEGLENFEKKTASSAKEKKKKAPAKKKIEEAPVPEQSEPEEAEVVETETVKTPTKAEEEQKKVKELFDKSDTKTREEILGEDDEKYEKAKEEMEAPSGKEPESEEEKPKEEGVGTADTAKEEEPEHTPAERTKAVATLKELQEEIRREDPGFSYREYIKEAFPPKQYAYELTAEELEKAVQELGSLCTDSEK